MRRAYSLKMAASLACARALKMISSGKFSMHENTPFALQLGAEFAAKMDGRCVVCSVFNRLWLHPKILSNKITAPGAVECFESAGARWLTNNRTET